MTVFEIIYELLNVNLPKTKVKTLPKLKEMHIFNSFCTDQLSNESWIHQAYIRLRTGPFRCYKITLYFAMIFLCN